MATTKHQSKVEPAAEGQTADQRNEAVVAQAAKEQIIGRVIGADGKPVAGAKLICTELGERLRLIARLLCSGAHARVYYTLQTGYDTHSDQLGAHARLLGELSDALKAFIGDLAAAGMNDRVVVLAFSEFGRRVEENGSQGTAHGTAGPVLLAGSPDSGGLVGTTPSLLDLEDGDLKSQLDFRRIYATLLERWLGVSPREVLDEVFEPLPLLKA